MVRSIILRGFDQSMAERIGSFMERHHTKFIKEAVPVKFSRSENGRILAEYKNVKENVNLEEEFDTVLLAIGRSPETHRMNLENVGVKLAKSGKIVVSDDEKSSVDNIYAIGDCAEGRPELTPPAIMAGRLLARRLFNGKNQLMDYSNIATTVFTPIEYGTVGYNEDQAYEKYIIHLFKIRQRKS